MTTVHVAASEQAAQFLAPNEIVPLLIGATVGEVERELVLQTLARVVERSAVLVADREVDAGVGEQDLRHFRLPVIGRVDQGVEALVVYRVHVNAG